MPPASVVLLLAAALLAGPLAGAASAQYFGQNKVQYRTFDFQVLRTDNFDIYFYPAERRGVEIAARLAERWNARLTALFGYKLSSRQPLILYASSIDFQQTNVIGGTIGEGTGGVTESLRRRIVMPFAGPLADTDHVLGHELVHAFQYDIAAQRSEGNRRTAGLGALPLWFVEGMAEYFSIGPRSALTGMWVRDAIAQERLPAIKDLDDPRYFPYRWGHALWAYIGGRWGDDAVVRLLEFGIDSGDPRLAFERVLNLTHEELSAAWHDALRQTYAPLESRTAPPTGYARALTPDDGSSRDLNLSPALSPDGKLIAFLSERDLFSVDLYVAEVETGRVIRRLTSSSLDPHLESLQFISSAGSWDPAGRQLAVTTVRNGRPVLALYDVEAEDRVRDIELPSLDGALHPAWSPDGTRVALVGMVGGLTDLFVVDLASGMLTRLTDDAFSELQPDWSPDGRQLAYATDRFTTSLTTVSPGSLQLAVLDVATRDVRRVGGFDRGKHIGPQWSADGTSLYFIANPDGVSNVYRISAAGTGATRLTALFTGVSGITDTSPALAVAQDRLAFVAFEDGAYRLYAVDTASRLTAPAGTEVAFDAADLPPTGATRRTVTQVLGDVNTGLPPAGAPAEVEPYRARLGLDYVGQPTVAVGADRFGAFGAGGISFVFGDMLGDHTMAVAFQATSSFGDSFNSSDLGGGVTYLNRRNRWNWGVAVDQTPYRTGFITESVGTVNGTPAIVQQSVISRQTDRGVTGIVAYPFNRAQRIEFSGAYRQLSFEDTVRTVAASLRTGQVLIDERQQLSDFPSLNLGQTSAALVYDTSSFGATSPVLGQRYRAEVTPLFGSLRYTGVLADYRKYFMPARLYTLAARVMHYGRYGGDADDSRLFPLFIGYPHMVRGYDVNTLTAADCPPTPNNRCEIFDRLVGTRMLVSNLEFRFPLLRPFGLSRGVYGPVPVELALFADGGFAWSSGDSPDLFGGDRKGVSSVGTAFRVNALGFAVLQFSFARPLQRPNRDWVFQFSLSPGF